MNTEELIKLNSSGYTQREMAKILNVNRRTIQKHLKKLGLSTPNYHNRLKQLLNTEKYICVPEEYPFAYRFIFPRLLKSMPIRDYRVIEYKKYIENGENDYGKKRRN